MLVRTRSRGLIEAKDGSTTSMEAEAGFTTSVEAADDSTTDTGATVGLAASGGVVSNAACKSSKRKPESVIGNSKDFVRNGPRVLTRDENTSTTGPKN